MKSLLFRLFALLALAAQAQHGSKNPKSEPADPHHHRHPFRVSLLLGHGVVPEIGGSEILFVPTYSLDVDYHLSDRWSLGIRNDIEFEHYIVYTNNHESMAFKTPLVTTADVFYRLTHNLMVGTGPGLELEAGHLKPVLRMGIEAEVPMNDRWEWTPNIYYYQRADNKHVFNIAVGVAHYL